MSEEKKQAINVVPFTFVPRSRNGIFTYETREQLEPGALVWVPFGIKRLPGIVIKTNVIPAYPRLKSIAAVITPHPVLPKQLRETILAVCNYYIMPPGLLFKAVFGPLQMEKIVTIPETAKPTPSHFALKHYSGTARYAKYISAIRTVIQKKNNIIVILPTTAEAESFISMLPSDLRQCVLVAKHDSSRIRSHEQWSSLCEANQKIIVGTRKALFTPSSNIGLIIIENATDPLHRNGFGKISYDAREVAVALAHAWTCPLIFGSYAPAPTLARFGGKKATVSGTNAKKITIAVRTVHIKKTRTAKSYSVFLQDDITAALSARKHILLLVARKGEASAVSCKNCGELIVCTECSAPMSLHILPDKAHPEHAANTRLICRHCGRSIPAPKSCPSCSSWELQEVGIAADRLQKDITQQFPGIWTGLLEGKSVIQETVRKKILAEFAAHAPAILIATKAIMHEKLNDIDMVTVPSADRFLAIPNFDANEQFVQMLAYAINSLNENGMLTVETYSPDHGIYKYIEKQNWQAFFQEELRMRKELLWPPYSRLITLTARTKTSEDGKRAFETLIPHLRTASQKARVRTEIIGPYPGFIKKVAGQHVWHVLIKVLGSDNTKNILDLRLQKHLRAIIPPHVDIDVSPESIL